MDPLAGQTPGRGSVVRATLWMIGLFFIVILAEDLPMFAGAALGALATR